jgi:diguanylate cyclase (GGDEF)-like protein
MTFSHSPQAASTAAAAPAPSPDLLPHLLALMNASHQAFALFDDTDTLRHANPVFRHLLGLLPDEYPSWAQVMRLGRARGAGTQVSADDFERWLASALSRRGKLPYRTIESQLENGGWYLTCETTLPDGWMLNVLTDISELAVDHRRLRHQRDMARSASYTDELTGLSNRRYLMEQLQARLGEHKASQLTLVLLDLDRFKSINDTHGHDTGDVVLRHFAGLLQAHTRRDDLSGRMGGEEFLLVIRDATTEQSLGQVQALLQAVRTSVPLADLPGLGVTVSAGLAPARPGDTVRQLLSRADEALYAAKAAGRDRCVVSDQS